MNYDLPWFEDGNFTNDAGHDKHPNRHWYIVEGMGLFASLTYTRLHAPNTPELITSHMTRAHANAHWQGICRERDARADEDLRANRLRDADRERVDRVHERIEQRQLADQILAHDLRAIHEEAERRQEYHAAGDANFDRLQDEVSSPSAPASPHPTGRRKRHRPARGRRQAAGREIVPKDEIVPDSEEELAVPDSSDDNAERESSAPRVKTQPRFPHIKSEGGTGRKSPAPRAKTEKGPTRVKTEDGPIRFKPQAGAARESHPPRVKTQVGPDRVKREAGTGPVQVKHEVGASPVRIKRKAGAAHASHPFPVETEVSPVRIKREAGTGPVQVKHEVGAGPVCIKHEAGAAFDSDALPKSTPVHAVVPPRRSARVGRDSLPALSDEDLAYPQSSRPSPPRSGKPAPLFDSDEDPAASTPASKITYVNSKRSIRPTPALPSPPPQLAVSATPPAATTPLAATSPNRKCTASTEAPLQVVVISDSSGEASPISRSVSSVSSLIFSMSSSPSSPSTSSAQLGKHQKVVMPTGPLMESASAAPGASSAPPKIFVNQQTRATYRSYKVALEAMGEDECVVPMDPEEAVRMISGLDPKYLNKMSSSNGATQEDLRMELVNATGAAPGDSGGNGAAVASSGGAAAAPGGSVASAPDGSAATGSKAPPAGNSGGGGVGAAPGAASGGGGAGTAPGGHGAGAAPGGRGAGAALPGGAGAVPGSAAAAGSGGEVPLADAIEPDDGDSNWVDEDALAGLASTHRSRNPLAPLIRARSKAKRVRGPNMKATERKRLQENRETVAEELAETHGMHIKEVKRRMNFSSAFKQRRKTSAYNATVALVMQELNEDLPAGSKYRATAVRQMMKDDPSLGEKYMAEEIEDKREELERKKLLRSVGVRASSKAAALDAKWVLENLTREITDLAERANMVGFAMFVRGDLHDQGIPTSIESRGALNFFRDVFHKSPNDVMALLEMWAVTKNKDGDVTTSLGELQKSCGAMILSGLRMITGKPNIAMNYKNYIKVLVQGRGVGLLVWPKEVEFKRMGKQSSLGPLRILYDHLKDGRTKWVKLSRRQEEKIVEEFEEMVREGKRKEKIRGRRNDLGGTHQVRNPRKRVHRRSEDSDTDQGKDNDVDIHEDDNSDDDDNEDPATSKKHTSSITTKKPVAPKPTKSTSTKKPTAPKKSSSTASGARTGRKRGAGDLSDEPPAKKQRTGKDNSRKEKRKSHPEDEGEERPRKKKKPAELKRLEKQMEKGREKAEENQARPKPWPIVKGKRGGPPGVRE
ncbi:hypothetical protein B0H14DRAFT_3472401 [Mycena olivaceomarginata]|nr:hypothetical protein B0H14DRAFT_3472401 [Mycena olivaceomarginata]